MLSEEYYKAVEIVEESFPPSLLDDLPKLTTYELVKLSEKFRIGVPLLAFYFY